MAHPRRLDLAGMTFGRWRVIEYAGHIKGKAQWLCECQCDNRTVKVVASASLRRGLSRSCGCYNSEVASQRMITHGHTQGGASATYRVWTHMINRCTDPACKDWKNYGGRGIRVCDWWRLFENFLSDMGERPSPKHSIDRIDNNGNYEPGNCRWATKQQQVRNKRNNRLITIGDKTLCLSDWSDLSGVHRKTIHRRLKMGWSPERAVFFRVS